MQTDFELDGQKSQVHFGVYLSAIYEKPPERERQKSGNSICESHNLRTLFFFFFFKKVFKSKPDNNTVDQLKWITSHTVLILVINVTDS